MLGSRLNARPGKQLKTMRERLEVNRDINLVEYNRNIATEHNREYFQHSQNWGMSTVELVVSICSVN